MAATVSSQPSNIHEIIRDCELFLVASRSSQLERLRGLYFKYAGRVSVQQELVSFKSSVSLFLVDMCKSFIVTLIRRETQR